MLLLEVSPDLLDTLRYLHIFRLFDGEIARIVARLVSLYPGGKDLAQRPYRRADVLPGSEVVQASVALH